MNDTGNRVVAGIIVVLLVIGAWYLGTSYKPTFGAKSTATSTATSTFGAGMTGPSKVNGMATTASTAPTVKVSGDSVSVNNQPAGNSVLVASVTLPQTGWVAVRDSSGRTLGAALFPAGTQESVQVPLLRDTVSGESYQVLLYVDDGDKQFDLHKDTLITNADGSVAGTTFTAN